jgi:hypothetical protein
MIHPKRKLELKEQKGRIVIILAMAGWLLCMEC